MTVAAPLRFLLQDWNGRGLSLNGHTVAPHAAAPFLVAQSLDEDSPLTVVVTATGAEAEAFSQSLSAYIDPALIGLFPAWETLPHERLSPRSDTVAQRLSTLRRMVHPQEAQAETGQAPLRVVVAPIRAVLQPIVPHLAEMTGIVVHRGDVIELGDLVTSLVDAAYVRVDMVERRGEFAVRGGIVDVFAPTDPHPVRIEFFGDEIDSIRSFSIADQRSLSEVNQVWAVPCRELLLTPEVRERARLLMDSMPTVADMLGKLSEGVMVDGAESLLPVLEPSLAPVTSVIPAGARFVAIEPERLQRRSDDLAKVASEFHQAAWHAATAGAQAPVESGGGFFTYDELLEDIGDSDHRWITVGPFGGDETDAEFHAIPDYRGQLSAAIDWLEQHRADGWHVIVTTGGTGSAHRIVEQLNEAGVVTRYSTEIDVVDAVVSVVPGITGRGWTDPAHRRLLISDGELTGRTSSAAGSKVKVPARRRSQVDPLQLKPGDFVVHEAHGVGKFVELLTRSVRGIEREYVVLEYAPSRRGAPGDRLSVPTDQLDQLTKYVGGEAPAVNKMGGADWAKTKGKARAAVKEIAAELIRLYSARMATEGYAFSADTPWQRELEEAFAFVETPDQLSTIDEVKGDMERAIPMDRLVCGDVGFGKTEIAVRAAFKAVQDGKQVAVLCPTTLLVKQHLDTFSDRFASFPVKIASLSRFQTDKEARQVIEGLAEGNVDVVIGTHRLLTGSVRFNDLGLVIVDEEQRFGVEHKETLKALRTNVDVLAMSATPIPRTLEMAITGIREMSTLATPPEERHPVLTYVGSHDKQQISAAIRRELLREGQVFYLHNSVRTINRAAAQIGELVPEARIAVAHGQMSEKELERVIVDYYEQRYDVLVCTTIVETGLDISNANTLIVESADKFGLSQLHQLRGRVGRARERAYAYFLYSPDKSLTEAAHERLQTIAAHTDLGAGMAVAMKDLEIRGAGNLLGGEQSGHIEGVGFDLYVRMVSDAVQNFRGEGQAERVPVTIDLPIDAHIPEEYIEHSRLRLEAYRKIADAADQETLNAIKEELEDRYGTYPVQVENLFLIAGLRFDLRDYGVTDVVAQGSKVRFSPIELPDSAALRMNRVFPGTLLKPATRQMLVPLPKTAAIGVGTLEGPEVLDWVRQVLQSTKSPALG